MRPWCTILIPTFNGQKYLSKLISAFNHIVDEGCLFLFVDDASMDDSVEIISKAMPHSRLLRNDCNLGLYPTINRALEYVKTDYVSVVFQDDVIESAYLQQMKC